MPQLPLILEVYYITSISSSFFSFIYLFIYIFPPRRRPPLPQNPVTAMDQVRKTEASVSVGVLEQLNAEKAELAMQVETLAKQYQEVCVCVLCVCV
jgi:hypothetical protein